jgi:hypothetical protein
VGYTKQTWVNNDPSKPLGDTRLNHMEDGIFTAAATADSAAGGVTSLNTLTTSGRLGETALNAAYVAASALTTDPASGSSTGYLSWKGSAPGSVPVVKPLGDGRAGVWEMTHNDTTGYLFHLLTGSSMGHSQALIALGVDNDGIGLLIPNKDNGRAIVGDQRATVADAAAYWMHVTQRSTAAPLIRLEQQAAGVAPLIQLLNFTGFSGRLLDIVNADGAVGNIQGDTGIMTWQRDIRIQDRADATASYLRLDSGAGASSSTMRMSYHGDDEDVFFGNTGAGGGYYPYKFAHSSSSFAFQTAATITGKGVLPLPADVGAYTTQLSFSHTSGVSLSAGKVKTDATGVAFFSGTPIARPAALVQTYATATRTLGAYTADAESAAYTSTPAALADAATLADLNALRVAYENLRAFVENHAGFTNALVDDLQAYGLEQ